MRPKQKWRCVDRHCDHKCEVKMWGEPDYCLVEGWEKAEWKAVKKRKAKT